MKKITSLILTLVMVLGLCLAVSSCESTDTTTVRVGYMAGPTGMGMAKLIHDSKEEGAQFVFNKYADTTSANTDLMTGVIDIACLPTNEAAKYYNSENADMQVLAINCLNSLCLLTNDAVQISSIQDLNGKTIYTCKNGTPRIILQKLLEAYGISANISYVIGEGDTAITINTPQDIPPVIVGNKADIVLAPEPIVSNALSKPVAKHKVTLDLGALWNEKFESPIAMGCIVVSKNFAKEHPGAIKAFLEDYKASIEFIANESNLDLSATYVVDAGIMAEAKVAKSAIKNLGTAISYIDGGEMKTILTDVYNIFGLPVIGGKLPDDSFYYEK